VTQILSELAKDPLEYYRKQALHILTGLLTSKPEIEDIILSLLVNKIGDTSKKVEGHAVQMLCKLLKDHPEMAPVVLHEAYLMCQRPGLKSSQKYYTLAFLNKLALISGKNEGIRITLFRAYFHMFKTILQNPSERKELVFKKDRTKSKKV
jgi:ribosome biogenesis protein MAK21